MARRSPTREDGGMSDDIAKWQRYHRMLGLGVGIFIGFVLRGLLEWIGWM